VIVTPRHRERGRAGRGRHHFCWEMGMSDYDLIIKGGTVVNAADITRADVGIRGGRIVALAESLTGGPAIDATGRYVMPGGVDSHCHIDQPSSTGGKNAESFESGTRSAACGGTTTIICFAPQEKGEPVLPAVRDYHKRAKHACIDYSFHVIVTDPTDAVMNDELPQLIAEGHRSLKLFMTYPKNRVDDREILRIFEVAKRHKALVCVHAENHDAIMYMTQKLIETGHNATKYHAWCKPGLVEREACQRVIMLSELLDLPIQIFHVSCAEAAEEIRRAQQRGVKVFAETCPQYFVLTADDLDRDQREGAKFICSPAPRSKADQEALWDYVRIGSIGNVTSDHAPYNIYESDGKFWAGDNVPFSQISNGVPGLETRMPIVFSEGVSKGRIDLQTFVALTSTNAAKLFGIYPQKGTVSIGADADLCIWDADKKVTITQEILHHDTDYTPYEGLEVQGWPETTISRGKVVWNQGEVMCEPGWGKFLARAPYDYIKPSGRLPTPFDPVLGKVVG
jgi:dihydropyrimidinase